MLIVEARSLGHLVGSLEQLLDNLEHSVDSLDLVDSSAVGTERAVPVQIQAECSWTVGDNFVAGHIPGASMLGWEHKSYLRSNLGWDSW
jgi:hypothetical protein